MMPEAIEIMDDFVHELCYDGFIDADVCEMFTQNYELEKELAGLSEEDIKRGVLTALMYDEYITQEQFLTIIENLNQ